MRKMKMWLASVTLAGALSLAACGGAGNGAVAPVKTNAAELTTLISKLEDESFSFKSEVATDIPALIAALPPAMKVTFDKVSQDAASGATVVTNLKFAAADAPELGVVIDEAKFWGLDTAFAIARLKGQQLDKAAPLARRIDAKGIHVVGLESVMPKLPVGPALPDAPAPDVQLETYAFTVDRYLFDDLRLRPYVVPATTAGTPEADIAPFLAAATSLSYDTQLTQNMKAQMVMREGLQRIAMDFGVAATGARGQRGGDIDFMMAKGMSGKVSVTSLALDPAASPTAPPTAPPIDVTFNLDSYEIADARLQKLIGLLGAPADKMPMEKDLYSFGAIKMAGMKLGLGGAQMASLGEISYAIPHTFGPTPTKFNFDVKDLAFDLGALFKFADDMQRQEFLALYPDMPPPGPAIDARITEVLTRHNLLKPSLDFAMDYDIGDKGDGKLGMGLGIDGFNRLGFKMDFLGPTAEQFGKAGTVTDPTAPNPFTDTDMALKGMELDLTDEGGLARIFAAAPDLIALMPEEEKAQLGPFANMSPQQLRDFAVNTLYSAAASVPETPKGLADAVKAVAAFVKDGGKTSVKLKAKKPIPMSAMQAGPPADLEIVSSHSPGK